MSRFPVIPENDLSAVQRDVHKKTADIFSRFPGELTWKNDDGLILGPYSSLFYTEDISDEWFAIAAAVTRQQRFSFQEKELAILAVLSENDAPYLRYAHSELALRAGFTQEQIQEAVHGQLPAGLKERESAVYALARSLTKMRRPLDDETFDKARSVLGRDGVAGVAHIVSGYIYVAMLTNISDGGAPEAEEGRFVATRNPALARE